MIRKTMSSIIFLFIAGSLMACSNTRSTRRITMDPATTKASDQVGAREYAVIEFEPGSSSLTEESREKLRSIATRAENAKKVEDIKILAWADREYPGEGMRASRGDVNVASARAEAIEDFISDDLNGSVDVDTYNMAKRPNALSRMFNTEDNEIKNVFERSGAAPSGSDNTLTGKASKALVLLDYTE